jgi:KUP system potassium uptake protein
VLIPLRAHNKGKDGTPSLMALAQHALGQGRIRFAMLLLGMLAASLFSPAISVLSAVEGLEVATPELQRYVGADDRADPGYAIRLAVAWHGARRVVFRTGDEGVVCDHRRSRADPYRRRARRARCAQPCAWCQVSLKPRLYRARHARAVFLAVTGAEAPYADLGHFGRKPIQTAWLFFVFPALVINYVGQGALVLADQTAIVNPFYRMVPEWALHPMIALATAATIIARQAVITGAFSLTNQVVHGVSTSCRPRFFLSRRPLRPDARSGMPTWQDQLLSFFLRRMPATHRVIFSFPPIAWFGTQVTVQLHAR